MTINSQNWQNASLTTSNLKASLSVGSDYQQDSELLYILNVLDHEDRIEYFRKEFSELEEAIRFINKNYGHWNYNDASSQESSDGNGCGTCTAH